MKITGVEAIILRQPGVDTSIADGSQDALLVLVHTDEGITGIGEVDSLPLAVKAIIDAPSSHANASGLAGVLIGEDPFAIDRLWHKMYHRSLYFGRRGAALHAMSGIDIALWDIKGKALGLPVHRLLGGPHRTDIRCYASTLMPNTPEEASEVVSDLTGRGFGAIKLGWGPFGQSESLDVKLLAAARRAAGDDVELMMDIGNGWPNALHAIRQVRRFEEYRPYWVEEPLAPDDIDGYSALVDSVNVPIAAGEEDTTLAGFDDLITRSKVDIVQPDVTRAGGITEMIRIAALAGLRGRVMVPHSWSTGIIKAATLQVIGAIPNAVFFEYCVQETPLNQKLTVERFPVVDGKTAIPTGPGIGIEIDLEAVQAFRSEA